MAGSPQFSSYPTTTVPFYPNQAEVHALQVSHSFSQGHDSLAGHPIAPAYNKAPIPSMYSQSMGYQVKGDSHSEITPAQPAPALGHVPLPEGNQTPLKQRRAAAGLDHVQGTTLAFKDIVYTVKVKDPDTKKLVDRQILKGCTGTMQTGTLNAIMGSSGGGKTSLLDVLADRKDPKQVNGEVLVDGVPRDHNTFKHTSGYVVQDDIVMGTLTVRENLMFSAELRLPTSVSKEEKEKRVQQVINELGLAKVAESRVGNEFVRGVSGGERKRVNIGMELITSPSILFLDEPTTGLDAATSFSVLSLLKTLAEHGRTIVLSIHQPRFKIFEMFDTVTLLSEGSLAYHGPSADMTPYFDSVGYPRKSFNNPADFVLDVLHGEELAAGQEVAPVDIEDKEERRKRIQDCQRELTYRYSHSELSRRALQAFEHEKSTGHSRGAGAAASAGYGAGWLKQVLVVSGRTLKNVIRNPATSVGQVLVNIVVAVITGVIYYRVDLQTEVNRTVRDRQGLLFFVAINLMFSNLSAVELILKERVIFAHEKVSGYYKVSAYFAAKILCDMIPVRLLPTAILSVIVYFMTGLQRTPEKFFWFLLAAELQSIVSASTCLLFGSIFKVFAIANTAVGAWYVVMMVFSGLLVSINDWSPGATWLGYFSFTKYAYEIFVENEFEGLKFDCVDNSEPCSGAEVLSDEYLNIETGRMGIKAMALVIYIIGILFLAFIALYRMKRHS